MESVCICCLRVNRSVCNGYNRRAESAPDRKSRARWCEEPFTNAYDWAARLVAYDWAALLGEIDEQDNCVLDFVAHMLAGRETVPESMTEDTLRKVAAFATEQAERLT